MYLAVLRKTKEKLLAGRLAGRQAGRSTQEYILIIPLRDMQRREGAPESAGIHRAQLHHFPRSDLILHHCGHLYDLQTVLACSWEDL